MYRIYILYAFNYPKFRPNDSHLTCFVSMVTDCSNKVFSVVYWHWGLNQILTIFIRQFFVLEEFYLIANVNAPLKKVYPNNCLPPEQKTTTAQIFPSRYFTSPWEIDRICLERLGAFFKTIFRYCKYNISITNSFIEIKFLQWIFCRIYRNKQ